MGTIQKIIVTLMEAFDKLQVYVPLKKTEDLTIMIHRAMTLHTRQYHTIEHVFSLVDSTDPFQSLATLFHDIIYYQADRHFSPQIHTIIAPYVREREGEILITNVFNPDDRVFLFTLDLFGVQAGQKLSVFSGLNEFLSTLIMNKELEGILAENDLVKISVCIEATIPFRGTNERGESYPEMLETRLKVLNEKYNLFLQTEEIEAAIKRAVVFSNKDVENFAEQDPAKFLDNTWKLLPETHASLRSRDLYTIKDYRRAIHSMEKFFNGLNPDHIFHQYQGVPSEKEFQQMVAYAHTNVAIAREYLGIKLLTVIITEALAAVTGGGDPPLSLFMGDLEEQVARIQHVVGEHKFDLEESGRSTAIFNLLHGGRASESEFDTKKSPLSALLYRNVGTTRIKQLLKIAKDMITGKMSAQDFLNSVDKPIVSVIARIGVSMVLTRKEQLLRYVLPDHLQE